MTRLLVAACVAALALPASALAQDPVADLLRQDTAVGSPDTYDGPADETPRDPNDPELGVTARLNADVTTRDRAIAQADADAEAARNALIQRQADEAKMQDAAYAAALDAHAADQRAYEARMAAWRTQADACAAGRVRECQGY